MELFIDTIEKGFIRFELRDDDNLLAKFEKQTDQMSGEILSLLDKFLKKHKVKLADLKKISVKRGPGPFSAVRSGVAVANALNFALGLSKKVILPKYNKLPNITSPPSLQSSPISDPPAERAGRKKR